ncbi:hypothetical protein [Chitinophaga sp.]|uniref:hypothetical protein n=1 Tax=Chitinophaga sp. TaxID=1869181 RepID=UPI0031DB7DAA
MLQFIPADVHKVGHTGYSTWKSAVTFLHDAIDRTEDILVVVDEDAFIVDWYGVEKLCLYLKENNILYAGMPDGGIIEHRFHSYIHINPFFAVFNCAIIKPLKHNLSRDIIDGTVFDTAMERFKPSWLHTAFEHDTIEPFAGLFYWLATIGTPLLLKADTMDDGISTVVKGLSDEPLCYHSWYSRQYMIDEPTQRRIDALYLKALGDRKREDHPL